MYQFHVSYWLMNHLRPRLSCFFFVTNLEVAAWSGKTSKTEKHVMMFANLYVAVPEDPRKVIVTQLSFCPKDREEMHLDLSGLINWLTPRFESTTSSDAFCRLWSPCNVFCFLTILGDLEEVKKKSFHVKEGCKFKLKITFYVQREIVSGLRYNHTLYRKGIKGKLCRTYFKSSLITSVFSVKI